ncbi:MULTISPECIES: helix-turn-helix domain-containing protein [unclassified Leptospira]|uniref:helix-turn-helix domain-containing protein n=1 Tax=unclassified Leptospira TaxID=2633828 RepID=UPI0002BEACBC|nr:MULTISPECIES: helix-turn-helix domain-containing protein [unclassified Leptospira]EMK00902.1 DNA-binding helix-turn-helix protein [Leptospira sp. B5-022]MCR1794700.1 helix-turn-helix domain-containing protein [Leptospira sp. id769339]
MRNDFNPLQLNLGIHYSEIAPSPELLSHIAYYWEFSSGSSGPSSYQVVPDACVDLILNINRKDPILISLSPTSLESFPIQPGDRWFGIRFLPSGIRRFFKIDLGEIKAQTSPFFEIFPKEAKELEEKLAISNSFFNRIKTCDLYFSELLKKKSLESDPRIRTSLQQMYSDFQKPTEKLGFQISSRHLRRLFSENIGLSPKEFAKILRFQTVLRQWKENGSLEIVDGFYDQSHFIKDWKKFTGLTPSSLRKFR